MQRKYVNEVGFDEARKPASAEMASFAEQLANRAQDMAERVNNKLHSVMIIDVQRPCEPAVRDGREYPPLFADFRTSLQAIEDALNTIDRALSRTEL